MSYRDSKRGFSLLELMVVVGIVAMVLAIALPVLSRARGDATIGKCLANMHQLALGTEHYGVENDGYLPWNGEPWGHGNRWWMASVVASLNLDCPARTEDIRNKQGRFGYDISIANWTEPRFLSGTDLPGVQVPDFPTRLSMITFPDRKIQAFEPTPWHHPGQLWEPDGVPRGEIVFRIHAPGERSPLAFMDGHARRFDYTEIADGWYPGTSRVWKSSIHGTPNGYRGRDVK